MSETSVQSDLAGLDDEVLLRRYQADGAGEALDELIGRYAPMVYAAAQRQVHDPAMADDVAQNVFVAFARRAGAVRSGAVIGAWLMQTTRYAAANAVRAENNRRRYEEAARQYRPHPEADPAQLAAEAEDRQRWELLRPCLDQAIAHLSRHDQSAVILRFFRGLSLREVAVTMGTTEAAACKRVSRALTRLRRYLGTRGAWPKVARIRGRILGAAPDGRADAADAALGALLAQRGVAVTSLKSTALAAAATKSAGEAARASIFHGVWAMSMTTKAAAVVVLGSAVLGAGYVVTRLAMADQPAAPTTMPTVAAVELTPAEQLAEWQDDFEKWTPDESLVAYNIQNDTQRNMAGSFAAQAVAVSQLCKATRERWGATAEQAVAHAFTSDTRLDDASAQITSNGDHAKFVFKSDVIPDMMVVRVDGKWKLDMAAYQEMMGVHIPDIIKSNDASTKIAIQALADFKAGKYATSDQLVADVKRHLDQI